ncbi:MAG: ATPase P [Oscillospiraceae bacterium]|nr:ATPase P [Oscillospiraceae bacterium]
MIITPNAIGSKTLPRETLEKDKSEAFKAGPCGVGREALYLGGRFFDRRYYICWKDVKRVFKRVAMSKGGYTGKGVFGSVAYLVVQFGKGKEVKTRFKHEADVDRILERVEREHPDIPVHSAKAEKKLAEAAAAEEARYLKTLSPEAEETLSELRDAKAYLENNTTVGNTLTDTAKQKRIADNMNPTLRTGAVSLTAAAAAAAIYGVYGLVQKIDNSLYFLLGGIALFAFILATNTLPSKFNSPRYTQLAWNEAVAASRKYILQRDRFPVPAQYAHPIVLERMIRIVREGRATTAEKAFELLKSDLKALNSSVTVTQKEHDEVVAIKPLFLVCEYKDEI